MHNLLFCAHKLFMNYVTNTLLLVSSSVRSKQLLCSVHRQGQKSEQKHITKKFVGFHNHSPLLTMVLRLPRYTIGVKKLAPLFHPIKSKTKTNRDSIALVFPRFASVTCNYFGLCLVPLYCLSLFCDWLEVLFWFGFTTLN